MKSANAPQQEPASLQLFLRIKHPRLDPDEITRTLQIQPEHVVRAGPAESETGVQRLHSETYWLAQLAARSMREVVLGLPGSGSGAGIKPLSKETLQTIRNATPHDFWLMDALRSLQTSKPFLRQLSKEGSVVLVVQRNSTTSPLSLRNSLALVTDLGIILEID